MSPQQHTNYAGCVSFGTHVFSFYSPAFFQTWQDYYFGVALSDDVRTFNQQPHLYFDNLFADAYSFLKWSMDQINRVIKLDTFCKKKLNGSIILFR